MKKFLSATIMLLLGLRAGVVHSQVASGTISGTVVDSSGAVLPDVQVQVENMDTGITRGAKTDSAGIYSVPLLISGNYRVTAAHTGFRTAVQRDIGMTVGSHVVVDLSLSPGAVSDTVDVTSAPPLVEATTATLGALVDQKQIRELPLNGRSYDQLALIQPGVVRNSPGNVTSTVFNYGTGTRFSVGGQRDATNTFLLDGTDVNDQANGTPGGAAGTNLGVDTIREFAILTNSNKAEYGRTTGAVVTAVTRSGTNKFHGTLFEYVRNSYLDTRNFFDTGSSEPPFRRNQFGAVLGGPLKRNKTFFFLGYEGLRQGQETTQIATVPTALARQGILPTGTVPVNPVVAPFLALYPLPNGRDFGDGTGQFLSHPNNITNEDNFLVRIDHQLTPSTGLFARYQYDNDSVNTRSSLPALAGVTASRRQYTTVQANTVLGPRLVNDVQFSFVRDYSTINTPLIPDPGSQYSLIPGQSIGAVQVGGSSGSGARAITSLGPPTGNGLNVWAYNVLEYADDVNYLAGKHSFKAGLDIQRIQANIVNSAYVKGVYTFTSFTNFLAAKPSNLTALGPIGSPASAGMRQTLFAAFAQDDYAVSSRVTSNIGFRWEAPTDPKEVKGKQAILPSTSSPSMETSDHLFDIAKKNFEARLGVAWKINSSGRTVLRVGGGIFHNQILPWAYMTQVKVPPFSGLYSKTNPQFPSGYVALPSGPPSAQGDGTTSLAVMNPYDKTPADYQYNVSFQQQLSPSFVFQASYASNHANHLEAQGEADTPVPVFLNGQPTFPVGAPRQNPAWNGIRYYSMIANSDYQSGTLLLRRQLSHGFEGQIFYTFQKSLDDASDVSAAATSRSPAGLLDPLHPNRDWGLSDFNSKHDVVFNFSYALPFRTNRKEWAPIVNAWALDMIGSFTSGQPFTPVLATNVSGNRAVVITDRPNLNPGFSSNPTHGTSAGCSGFAAGTPIGTPANWFDPCAFSLPSTGTYGNLSRNSLIGPGVDDVDLTLQKTFLLRWEGASIDFRTEVFNVMNHANFGLPNTLALQASGSPNPSAGTVTYTTTSSREVEFALRINF
jgi:hypothetical protein